MWSKSMFRISSQLRILCTPVKQYYTNDNDSPVTRRSCAMDT